MRDWVGQEPAHRGPERFGFFDEGVVTAGFEHDQLSAVHGRRQLLGAGQRVLRVVAAAQQQGRHPELAEPRGVVQLPGQPMPGTAPPLPTPQPVPGPDRVWPGEALIVEGLAFDQVVHQPLAGRPG
jgi:hypothetical protein